MQCRLLILVLTIVATPAWALPEVGALQVGRDARDLVTLEGVPLSGFGSGGRRKLLPKTEGYTYFLKASEGLADRVRVKSIAIKIDNGAPFLFISMDIVGTSATLADAVATRLADLGVVRERLWLNATHSHSGPGAVIDAPFWEFMAADRLHSDVLEHVIVNIAASARAAVADLQPAQWGLATTHVTGLSANRRHPGAAVDTELLVIKLVSSTNEPLAAILHYAIHGTCYGSSNLLLSADNQGYFERYVEAELAGAVALFANGAQGDVDPIEKEQAGAELIGATLGAAAVTLWNDTPTVTALTFEAVAQRRPLPSLAMDLSTCEPLLAQLWDSWAVSIPGPLAETEELFSAVRWGDTAFVTIPGEAITVLGEQIKTATAARGFAHVWIWGLTQGHMGYLLTPEEFDLGGYEACAAPYGRESGSYVATIIDDLAATLSVPLPGDDGADLDDGPLSHDGGDPTPADVDPPGDPTVTPPESPSHQTNGCSAMPAQTAWILALIALIGGMRRQRCAPRR